jgi:hypothetical protein
LPVRYLVERCGHDGLLTSDAGPVAARDDLGARDSMMLVAAGRVSTSVD